MDKSKLLETGHAGINNYPFLHVCNLLSLSLYFVTFFIVVAPEHTFCYARGAVNTKNTRCFPTLPQRSKSPLRSNQRGLHKHCHCVCIYSGSELSKSSNLLVGGQGRFKRP